MDENKVISLDEIKAKAAGVSSELVEVINQLNERFGIRIDFTDERLERFKLLHSALDQAAKQKHEFRLDELAPDVEEAFRQGVEVGKAQMMTDVIVCILEQDGVIERK